MLENDESPENAEDEDPRPRRVLVVEDDEGLNNLAQEVLREAGYDTDGALKGADAIERVVANPDVALLLDITLPDMTGSELISALVERGCPVSFIVMTGRSDEETAVEMMKLGASDYLAKGWDLVERLPGAFHRLFREIGNERRLRAAEEALQKGEERFRQLSNATWEGIVIHEEGIVLEANDQFFEMFGYKPEELIGEDGISRTTTPESNEFVRQQIAAGNRGPYKATGKRKDGTEFPMELRIRVMDYQGRQVRVAAIRDKTDQERAEEALRESESKLREAQQMARLGNWFWDVKAGDVEWSEEVYKIFCLDPEEFTPQIDSILALSPWPKDHQRDQELIQRAVESHEQGSYEQRFLRPDGSTGYYFSTFQGIYDDDGDLTAIKGTVQDVTERKRAEEELRRLRNYLFNIVNSMPSVLVGVDPDGKVTEWNREAQRATGIPAEDAVGQPLDKAFPRMAAEMERVRESMQAREVYSDPRRARSEDDKIRYEDVTVYPLIGNGVEGAVIRVDDVTERVRIEEMMVQSEKMLSVGGLAAGMAHEINNPLAGIMQTADVMARRLTDKSVPANLKAAEAAGISMEAIRNFMEIRNIPRMIASINESGHRLATIVDNMLSFARKSEFRTSSHSLEKLLDKTLELATTDYDLRKHYDFKTIEIIREYEDNVPPVPCEGAKIQQVLLNILRNGAQAMQEAGTKKPRFVVRTRCEIERRMVCMEIEDNGPGMDEATRKRVFEPFFTTKPMGVGTGLGLSVSYFIITENHGGEMVVESTPGSGAKFFIRLPLEEGKA